MSAEERLMVARLLLGGASDCRDLHEVRLLGLAAIRHLSLAVEAIG